MILIEILSSNGSFDLKKYQNARSMSVISRKSYIKVVAEYRKR